MPKVSVIVPTYNSGGYVRETLLSILDQDYQDFEIIVVDDASTDNTSDVITAMNSCKINYVSLPENHGGPSKARNVGVAKASGAYIAIFDSDDIMLAGRLSTAVTVLDRCADVAMTFTDIQKFDELTGDYPEIFLKHYDRFASIEKKRIQKNVYAINNKQAFNCLFFENFISTSSVTIRKSVFGQVGLFDESLTNADDLDMWFRISHRYDLAFVDTPTVRYRVREGSISGRGATLANNRIRVYRKRMELGLDRETRDQALKQIATNYAGMGYSYRCLNHMQAARRSYLSSLKERMDWRVIIQYLVTYLGNDIIGFIRRMKRKFLYNKPLAS